LGQHSIEGPVAKGAAGDREVGEANTGPGSPACLSRVRTARSVADPHRCGIRRSCAADTGIDACPRCSQRPRPPALVDTQAALAGRSAVIRQLWGAGERCRAGERHICGLFPAVVRCPVRGSKAS